MRIESLRVSTAAAVLCLATGFVAEASLAQDTKSFNGVYAGLGAASQNVWGGSFVDGTDVLAQDRRNIWEMSGGWRKQFGWFVAGAEVQVGLLDGDLSLAEPGSDLAVQYENSRQFGFGLTAGASLGVARRWLAYVYAFESQRSFAVTVVNDERTFRQKDEQGFLRYGLGVETRLTRGLHARGTIGSYRVDFGDLITNIDVAGELEYTVGLVYQFGG